MEGLNFEDADGTKILLRTKCTDRHGCILILCILC